MRILLNMTSQYGGKKSGVALVGLNLLEHLIATTGHDYILRSAWSLSDLPPALHNRRLTVMTVPRPRFLILDVFRQALVMPVLCLMKRIDVVLNVDPFGACFGGKKRITIVHDLYFNVIPDQIGPRVARTTDIIFRITTAGSHRVVCISETTRADMIRWRPSLAARSQTIYSDSTISVTADEISDAPRPIAEPYILAVGNATPNKNFEVLGHAFARLKKHYGDLKLVHVGVDPREVIDAALDGEQDKRSVIRKRNITDRDLAILYKHALCLCVPSLYEGFCLPILEAQSFGTPVVCGNRSASAEIAGDGALQFDPTDVAALAAALSQVISDQPLAERLRQKGYENRKRFSWKAAAAQYASLF